MKKKILITGGTGILGPLLVKNLLELELNLTLLVRKSSYNKAVEIIKDISKASKKRIGVVEIIECDLKKENLGLSKNDYKSLADSTKQILHAAASTKFDLSIDEARSNNVFPTKNMLTFANNCKNLTKFGMVSTAYVAGKRTGIILEDEFEHHAGFINTYQESKYEAESEVRKYRKTFPIVVFRPSILITPYNTTSESPINALTMSIILVQKGFLPVLPGNGLCRLDVISADFAASSIIKLFTNTKNSHTTYQITSNKKAPRVRDIISLLENKYKKKFPVRYGGEINSYHSQLNKITMLRPDLKVIYYQTRSFLPEIAFPKEFSNKNLLNELQLKNIPESPIEEVKGLFQ